MIDDTVMISGKNYESELQKAYRGAPTLEKHEGNNKRNTTKQQQCPKLLNKDEMEKKKHFFKDGKQFSKWNTLKRQCKLEILT